MRALSRFVDKDDCIVELFNRLTATPAIRSHFSSMIVDRLSLSLDMTFVHDSNAPPGTQSHQRFRYRTPRYHTVGT